MTRKSCSKKNYDIDEDNIYSYLANKLGLGKPAVTNFLKALSEFIIVQLVEKGEVRLYRIGKFTLKKGKVRTHVRFTTAPSVVLDIKEIREKGFIHTIIKSSANDYKIEEHHLKPSSEQVREICQELRSSPTESRYLVKRVRQNFIRYHFLCYLQREFPYKENWIHPESREEIDWKAVKKALLHLRQFDPDGYRVFYLMWLSLESRSKMVKEWGYSQVWVANRLYKTTDSIISILLNKDLIPNCQQVRSKVYPK